MTTYDLDRMLGEWMDAAEPMSEPPALLPSVFTVTRSLPQRRGLTGRMAVALRSGSPLFQLDARPLLTYAILILLLLSMTFAVAFASGLLRTPFPTGWRALDTDAPEFSYVSTISKTPHGFVALGEVGVSDEECRDKSARAYVWTSRDGNSWEEQSDESLAGLVPQLVISSGESTYIFGSDYGCLDSTERVAGGGGWRTSDGESWERLADSPDVFQFGNVPMMVDLNGTLIALAFHQDLPEGGVGDFGTPEMRVMSSTDGENWAYLTTLDGYDIVGLAVKDGVLVALGNRSGQPEIVMLRSVDGGRTWDEQELPSGLPQSLAFIVADDERFVAAGDEVAVTSSDGTVWEAADVDPAILDGVTGLWAHPSGFLAIRDERADGEEGAYCTGLGGPPIASMAPPTGFPATDDASATMPPGPTETCMPTLGGGGTAISTDGLDWQLGPDLPVAANPAPPIAYWLAADDHSLVVAELDHGTSIWYSPLDAFRAK